MSEQSTSDPRLLMPVSEVAGLFGVSRMTVHRRIKAGRWPSSRCGTRHLIPKAFVAGVRAEIEAGRWIDIDEFAASWLAKAGLEAAS